MIRKINKKSMSEGFSRQTKIAALSIITGIAVTVALNGNPYDEYQPETGQIKSQLSKYQETLSEKNRINVNEVLILDRVGARVNITDSLKEIKDDLIETASYYFLLDKNGETYKNYLKQAMVIDTFLNDTGASVDSIIGSFKDKIDLLSDNNRDISIDLDYNVELKSKIEKDLTALSNSIKQIRNYGLDEIDPEARQTILKLSEIVDNLKNMYGLNNQKKQEKKKSWDISR